MGRIRTGWIAPFFIALLPVLLVLELIPHPPSLASDLPQPKITTSQPALAGNAKPNEVTGTNAAIRSDQIVAPSQAASLQPVSQPASQSTLLDGPPLQDVPTWSQVARAILLTAIPDQFVDRKHWGMTREMFDGLQVKQRGLNIRVSERRKKVNHGTWYMLTVRFPKPEQNAKLIIDQVQTHETGNFSCAIHVALRNIQLHGQFEQWVLGVKGLNFDVESDVEVHIHAVVQLMTHTEWRSGSLLPDVVLEPTVRSVRLDLVDVNTHRIGRVGGDIAEELGDSTRKLFEDLIHSQEGRVLKKANEAIQKKRDSLRLPASRLW